MTTRFRHQKRIAEKGLFYAYFRNPCELHITHRKGYGKRLVLCLFPHLATPPEGLRKKACFMPISAFSYTPGRVTEKGYLLRKRGKGAVVALFPSSHSFQNRSTRNQEARDHGQDLNDAPVPSIGKSLLELSRCTLNSRCLVFPSLNRVNGIESSVVELAITRQRTVR